MTLTIYGSPHSRTMRVLWTAAELDLTYEHIPLTWDDPYLKSPEFLRLNPAGTIPVIVDDGVVVAESMAINLYLAKRYGGEGLTSLYPTDAPIEAEIWRWSLWAQGHVEPWVQRDAHIQPLHAAAGALRFEVIARAMAQLERALDRGPWLAGGHFTVGDLNVAAVLSPSRAQAIDLNDFPNVSDWIARCYDRPAAQQTRRAFA